MAAEIKRAKPGAGVQLVKGSNGIFEVYSGNALVFSKNDSGGRFPEVQEVIDALS